MNLIFKLNALQFNISKFISANGPGRAVGVSETTEVGDPSGFATFFNQLFTNIGNALLDFGEFLLRCLARLAYFIATIALNIMDFMNVVIRELSGQAANYSVSGNTNLEESDILFQFLFNELTIKILKYVFVFALLLLIIFTIMAIVKQEWQSHISGELKNVKKILKKVLLSIFTMLIVPFVLIVGIVFSNVVLSSAMGALTGGQQNFSLGAQIFSSTSYEANKYRKYAEDGMKIPIVFDYDGGFENTVTTKFPELTEESTYAYEKQLNELLASGNFETGQSTYNMFKEENFYQFSGLPDSSSYYSIYDGGYLKTKQIEYYTMADFLDFALLSGGNFYVVNTEKVYMTALKYINAEKVDENRSSLEFSAVNIKKLTDEEKEQKFICDSLWSILDTITALDENGDNLFFDEEKNLLKKDASNNVANINSVYTRIKSIVDGDRVIDELQFKVLYDKPRTELLNTSSAEEVGAEKEKTASITYTSRAGSTDEVTGAKYLLCHRYVLDEKGSYIYVPVRQGDMVNGYKFSSSFLSSAPKVLDKDGKETEEITRNESFFIARGIFTSAGYPTAIREDGNTIVYYRQDPKSPSALNFSEIFNYQTPNDLQANKDNASGGSFDIGEFTEFLTGVDVATLVPDIKINLNFLRAFTKADVSAAKSEAGRFVVNYSFVGCDFSMHNLYDELSINYVVLLIAVVLLFKSLFYIIWGLIQRIYEITLLWITFPGFVAKHPLENTNSIGDSGTSFYAWKEKMIERVLALYSIYLSLALVLLLVPIVFKMDYITTFNISEESIFAFQILNGDVANLVIKTMFVLVLFNLLSMDPKGGTSGLPRIIEQLVLWSNTSPKDGYLTNIGAKTLDEIKSLKTKAVQSFTVGGIVKNVKGAALNTVRGVGNAIPGRALFDRATDAVGNATFNKRNDAMLKNAQADMLANTASDADVEAQTKKVEQATKDHAYMEDYRRARSDHNRGTGGTGKDFKEFRSTREARSKHRDLDKDIIEVAKYGGGGNQNDNIIKEIKRTGKKPRNKYRKTRKRTGV